ncbi:ABC transporter substrate-binding protein [Schleiferilactobacillus harbinensis]|uniref:ABC transporter substrate-binding protein n=1 Tax=Schleiferilactobacillus harbinensis TaxID=304207 RepID=UPI0039E8DB0B
MKGWKKIGLTLMATATALTLTACGGDSSNASGESNGKVTIQFMHWGGTDTYKGDYQKRIEAFEKANPKIKVKTITVGDNYDTKLQTMIAGNKAPDVAQVAENGTGFASKNAFIDLDPYIKKDNLDMVKTYGNASALYKWKGKFFGMPDRGGSGILVYNKKIFDKAGLAYPNDKWTMQDFYNAAKKLTIDGTGKEKKQYGTQVADYVLGWGGAMMSNGGSVINAATKKATINSPENVKTFEEYNKNFKESSIPYQVSEDKVNRFQGGKVAMILDGMWQIQPSMKLKGMEFDIAPMPGKYTWSTGSALTISRQSDKAHQDAAWKFIKYMGSYKAQQILGKNLMDCPANLQVLDSKEFQDQKIMGKTVNMKAIAENQRKVKIDGMLKGPWYAEAMTETSNQLKEMLLGHQTPAATLKSLQSKLQTIVNKY